MNQSKIRNYKTNKYKGTHPLPPKIFLFDVNLNQQKVYFKFCSLNLHVYCPLNVKLLNIYTFSSKVIV